MVILIRSTPANHPGCGQHGWVSVRLGEIYGKLAVY